MLDIADIEVRWADHEPQYIKLGTVVSEYLKDQIPSLEILPEISHRIKTLLSIIKKIKKKQRYKEYSYESINDKLGVRIICDFQEEMNIVDAFIKKNFEILNAEYKYDELDFDKLDYVSNHYDVKVSKEVPFFQEMPLLEFEIQVRTLNQHAWSNTAHKLSYKNFVELSPILKRKVYRLLSLYEIADDEFSAVFNYIKKTPKEIVLPLIMNLEGKIFRFAKVDYDKKFSMDNLQIILDYLPKVHKTEMYDRINAFINLNEDKVQRIFEENRSRFHEIPFLSQPEVFVIWYLIEKHQFLITDNWESDFDIYELEQLATLWGKSLE